MIKIKSYLTLLLVLTILQSCMKQPQVFKETTCYHFREYPLIDSAIFEINYQFDEQNRLVRISRPMGTDDSISYEPGKITIDYVPRLLDQYTIFYLNEDGLAESCDVYLHGVINSRRHFTYTPDRYLATIQDSSKSGLVNYTLTYTDGNLTQFDTKYANIHAIAKMEYYPEDLKFWTYLATDYYVGNCVYYPWMGKPNKSLRKSIRFQNGGGIDMSYSYELDERGYVTKRTRTFEHQNASYEVYVEYDCK